MRPPVWNPRITSATFLSLFAPSMPAMSRFASSFDRALRGGPGLAPNFLSFYITKSGKISSTHGNSDSKSAWPNMARRPHNSRTAGTFYSKEHPPQLHVPFLGGTSGSQRRTPWIPSLLAQLPIARSAWKSSCLRRASPILAVALAARAAAPIRDSGAMKSSRKLTFFYKADKER